MVFECLFQSNVIQERAGESVNRKFNIYKVEFLMHHASIVTKVVFPVSEYFQCKGASRDLT